MKNSNPCKLCLVKACCKINQKTQIYECGCDPYEIYRTKELLKYHSDVNSFAWQNLTKRLREMYAIQNKNK